ncbi:MAG: Asp-tRNA(Asn)/Glu-tRNA(Gln) amidotransferase subunit GatB [Firmicutes bacterium]|nr:Asp-tRNA(Asn)/Glu-tRNA(Gln) amidotransferase subunit GatB [Bacillota bacterium]MDD4263532.1 Asp-tRNA(Asn)/Glu-tRNA(Gln) amidotransferase subunit GatB [Bacillota bacterium]MDD4694428.1 Asp-tRNA(Asn)/Glu-tRNA(Gln) amidotransferase subunit GatB [Bacillota bacterium]
MPLNDYTIVIGLEVHAELMTKSKLFCGCSTSFGSEANSQVCPRCLGLPGTLPVLNKKAVEYAVKAGLAFDCDISKYSKFDRKNYFYPDLSKAYQISQFDQPICGKGHVEFYVGGEKKVVGINRIHLEEEAGKSVHSGATISDSEFSLEDYNRCGIPLIEIVSEPDMRSPEEARIYMETLRNILRYVAVSDCKMEEGSLRCDANISLMPKGATKYGTRTEIKNMNSFRAVQKALEYEALRHAKILDRGEKIVQETRTWDDIAGITASMRSKEEAHDYRYFPEPDLVPIVLTDEFIDDIKNGLPELPVAKFHRYVDEYELPEYDAELITADKDLAEYFEAVIANYKDYKAVSNWLMGEFMRLVNEQSVEISEIKVKPEDLAMMFTLQEKGVISSKIAKTVFEEMFHSGKDPETIVKEKGLVQISDASEIEKIVLDVIEKNPGPVAQYLDGKERVLGFLVGQVMKLSKGKANPQMANDYLRAALAKMVKN